MADDWVVKGFHLTLDGVELAVRPTHTQTYLDGFVFVSVFSSTSDAAFAAAARRARDECLTDPTVRARWRRDLERGMKYVRSFSDTALADKANGRQYEFLRLIWHLDAYGERHGDA